MERAYYAATLREFLLTPDVTILGTLAHNCGFDISREQRDAWAEQITILKSALEDDPGSIYFEYSIPRMGRRADVVIISGTIIFVVEFKIGAAEFSRNAVDQVWDYALDLKNFHETSHDCWIAPILIASNCTGAEVIINFERQLDKVFTPIKSSVGAFPHILKKLAGISAGAAIAPAEWERGRYHPTPTIVEAAMALYRGHSVHEISRSDAGAINLTATSDAISNIIHESNRHSRKSICFVTGVPGAGKTLVGLNIATKHIDKKSELYSIYLSGNDPLVNVLEVVS
ncbi:MAG: DUF2075 domain-containing protein [Planctomycetes bacterium]|nr:DUF2075 domain-containing protein [Planctomycetota bacterium]